MYIYTESFDQHCLIRAITQEDIQKQEDIDRNHAYQRKIKLQIGKGAAIKKSAVTTQIF